MAPRPTTSRAGVVERTFTVLQAIVAADSPVGVRELERRTGVPRSTISRALAVLESMHMIERNNAAEATPGSALETLQPGRDARPMLRDQLRPLLHDLVAEFDENAALTIESRDEVEYLIQVTASNAVQAPSVEFERHACHLVAPGLIHMAAWPASRLNTYLRSPLEALTSHSTVDPNLLRDKVELARSRGWAWTNQELDVGVNGLAVAVEGAGGAVVAAVSLYGPSYRFSEELLPEAASRLRDQVIARTRSLI